MATTVEFEQASQSTEGAQKKMHYVSRVGVTPDEVTDIYNTWANSYDNVSTLHGFCFLYVCI